MKAITNTTKEWQTNEAEPTMAGCRVVRRTKKPTGSRAGCLRALRGGRFEWRGVHPTPGTKKGFCIPVFVILGKRWCVGKKSTFSLVYSQIILINAKTPHFRAVFLLCIFFINTFWRKRWDSNPRALADNLISSQARYDHFDTLPYRIFNLCNPVT